MIHILIRELRQKRGLTVQQLADLAGFSKGLISQIENEITAPTIPTLRKIAGQKTVEIDLVDGKITAQDLLDNALERYPAMRKELIDADGNLYGHVHLFVNGRDSRFLEHKLNTIINPEDKIDIFPAVGGG